jgi:hypothetical protein
VAAHTADEVEARADAIGHALFLREVFEPHREHFALRRGQARDGTTPAGRPASDAGVPGPKEIRLDHPGHSEENNGEHDE